MAILVSSGHENSAIDSVQAMLQKAGLAESVPFRDQEFTPPDLVARICEAHKVVSSENGGYQQLSPAKFWQSLSVDLLLANLDQPAWGWADSRNIHLLEYWKEFDPRFGFVLVYASPRFMLAQLLEKGPLKRHELRAALKGWQAYNEALLSFYNANRDRALLVNAEQVLENPASFISACRDRFELDLSLVNEPVSLDREVSAMANWQATQELAALDADETLMQELESACDLPMQASDQTDFSEAAWEQYRQLKMRLEEAEAEIEALRKAGEDHREKAEADGAGATELAESRRENELLLLQLQQVQEELEHYFLKYQEIAKSGAPRPDQIGASPEAEQATVRIDMRHFIDGENWHEAEHDGRWAGPGKMSRLNLPALEKGRYRIELDVVGAMSAEILRGTELHFNGRRVALARKSLRQIPGALGALKKAGATIVRRGHVLPIRLSGIIDVDEKAAAGRTQLELRFPDTSSPTTLGETDYRELAIRIREITLSPLTRQN